MNRVEAKKELFYELHAKGLTFSDIARQMGVFISEVSLFAKHYNIKSNFEYGDKVFRAKFMPLYEQGFNDCYIAKETGKSSSAVQAYRKSLNLPVNRKNKITLSDLTEIELGIMIGGLLGDSYIQPAYHTGSGGFAHSTKQEDYFMWKYNRLERLCSKITHSHQMHTKTKSTYYKVYTSFKSGQYVDELMKIFYKDRVKCIPDFEFVKQHFNDYSLAVWFGDDGSQHCLATMAFSHEIVENLANVLQEKYGFDKLNINKKNNILLKSYQNRKLAEIIKPILPESMHYKFVK